MDFSFSVLLRSICHKLVEWSARSVFASWFNLDAEFRPVTANESVLNQYCSPWLMLSPESIGGTMSNKFYSLADNKVETPSPCSDVIRNHRMLTCRGSSHGWLALVSPQDDQLFLYNPISGRHINLPSIVNLPRLPIDDLISMRDVAKLILSCSPDEDEENCRAVVINGCGNALAFCFPGRSKEWTMMFDKKRGRRGYVDIVYSDKQKLFFVLTNNSGIETWDLGDDPSSSPKLIKIVNLDRNEFFLSSPLKGAVKLMCGAGTAGNLVVAKEDLLLFVIRYVVDYVGPDGQCFGHTDKRRPDYVDPLNWDYDYVDGRHPDRFPARCHYMTVGFDIWKHDPKSGKFNYLDSSSLGDLAIFVGEHSHSVAIPATHEFSELKPNSIYFTDGYYTGSLEGRVTRSGLFGRGGHDIGIYNYKDRTVSPCYYPCDASSVKTILPAPIWFFPSQID
ncbi:hypothetical protein CASFOL_013572 [Castilleja foliolosa]|uniref:KIB1-4 beta-propeller domain-containing protein n=1 Tax=Castilleja foliolosa TaxID=1961234 RepID=A0ABD3DM69_9LAMI